MLIIGIALNLVIVLPYTVISYLGRDVPLYVYFSTESGQLCSGFLLASAIFKLRRFFSKTGFRDKINQTMFLVHAVLVISFTATTTIYLILYSVFVFDERTDIKT